MVLEFDDSSEQAIKDSWLLISETIKALERAKDRLKPKVEEILAEQSTHEIDGYQFRRTVIQRMNYDKAVMREVLDADLFDELLVPDKTKVDTYLKENVENLGEVGNRLRKTMQPIGNPYTAIRLEKL